MCGIAGLFLKDRRLEPRLGELLAAMLTMLEDRGPDSMGFAVYAEAEPDSVRLTITGADPSVSDAVRRAGGTALRRADHVLAIAPAAREVAMRDAIMQADPQARIVAVGQAIELYKAVGTPSAVASRFGLASMAGTHAIGHTRMATESAVTPGGAHPFSTGPDQCLVHNGSLSNHNALRRKLAREGLVFETQNDTEVAAGYLSWRMAQGAALHEALESALSDLDGFYTFVVGTRSGFGVLRDPIACKPAVMAETDAYVAFGSEYRALAMLPGIERAQLFEPEPARVYVWERT